MSSRVIHKADIKSDSLDATITDAMSLPESAKSREVSRVNVNAD